MKRTFLAIIVTLSFSLKLKLMILNYKNVHINSVLIYIKYALDMFQIMNKCIHPTLKKNPLKLSDLHDL